VRRDCKSDGCFAPDEATRDNSFCPPASSGGATQSQYIGLARIIGILLARKKYSTSHVQMVVVVVMMR
jgi:hypothetical protein